MKFTNEHEWVRLENDVAVVGITNYAQEQLGDVVFVELPDVGTLVTKGDETCVIESVKAAGEIKAPVSGEIIEINGALADDPALVNTSAMDEGWFYKIRMSDSQEADTLLSEADYNAVVESLT